MNEVTEEFRGSNFIAGDWENGFGIQFQLVAKDLVSASYTYEPRHQGPRNIAHGGALAALIDEAMTAAVFLTNHGPAWTVSLNLNYQAPVYLGTNVTISGHIRKIDGRKIFLYAEMVLVDGTVAVSADGLFIQLKKDS